MQERNGRRFIGLWIKTDGADHIQKLADQETGGKLSEMVRKLLTEATTARARKDKR